MNILIVDDIATNRKLLRVTLEAEGHATLEAADGVEALQILGRETVDAVAEHRTNWNRTHHQRRDGFRPIGVGQYRRDRERNRGILGPGRTRDAQCQ